MTADVIAIPVLRQRNRNNGSTHGRRHLNDIRELPLKYQPQPITQPGEKWHVNAYNLTQLIVLRDEDEQRTVAEFRTARDAIAAAQCRAMVEDILALPRDDEADLGRAVLEILKEYGR